MATFGDLLKLNLALASVTVRQDLLQTMQIEVNGVVGYCSKQNMIDSFGEDELIQRTDRNNTGTVDTDVLNFAMLYAGSEIDGYLSRYELPLAHLPAILVRIACDIARYYLYDDQMIDVVDKRYKSAVKQLESISKGITSLGVDSIGAKIGGDADTSGQIIEMSSARSVFGR